MKHSRGSFQGVSSRFCSAISLSMACTTVARDKTLASVVPMDELLSKLRSQASSQKLSTQQEDDIPESKDLPEITTSQSEGLRCNRFRLDFDFLRSHRTGEFVSVADVRESELFRLDGPLWAMVKSIEMFRGTSKPVYRWELCDETGVIFGSSTVGDPTVTVGSVVCLANFSLWKFEGNHLNIVERNIRSVIQ